MGQSNIWYADSDWAREVLLPAVEKYLSSLHGQYPIQYLKAEDLYKKISPTRYSDEYLSKQGENTPASLSGGMNR